MRLTIHQPAYLPWLGLISKINASDKLIILDHVKYSHNSFDNRNRIGVGGKDHWLTIPVTTKGGNETLNKVLTVGDKWKSDHLNTIKLAYHKAPFFQPFFGVLEQGLTEVLKNGNPYLFYYGMVTTGLICGQLDAGPHKYNVISSKLSYKGKNTGSQMILDLCLQEQADEYVSGPMGKDYLDIEAFKKAGIKVLYHHWDTKYYLSAIHYLFTLGPNICKQMLTDLMTVEEAK